MLTDGRLVTPPNRLNSMPAMLRLSRPLPSPRLGSQSF